MKMNSELRTPMQAALLLAALLNHPALAAPPDWLIEPASFKAQVTPGAEDREVTLDNGLVRRIIRLQPNAATIAYENLMTGESIIRSVRPEAMVELDGVKYDVGGLVGKPVHNYLDVAWVDNLQAEPGAFRFTSFRAGKTAEWFPWKKRTEWMPKDLPWPPPGVSLTLEFAAPQDFGQAARPMILLLADEFTTLSPEWKVSLSKRHERTSFQNEGKIGEIMAQANNFAFAERPWLAGACAVQCLVNPGTDRGASWGSGLALVFPIGVVKFNLRPERGCFGIAANGGEVEHGKLEAGKAYALRMTLGAGRVACEASLDGQAWQKIGEARMAGTPVAARVGKMNKDGGASDFAEDGPLERCRVAEFRLLGEPEPAPAVAAGNGVTVEVHYELYDGIPLLSKWIVVRNGTEKPVRLNSFICEILAAVEPESIVDDSRM
jgi:hypothetical protein